MIDVPSRPASTVKMICTGVIRGKLGTRTHGYLLVGHWCEETHSLKKQTRRWRIAGHTGGGTSPLFPVRHRPLCTVLTTTPLLVWRRRPLFNRNRRTTHPPLHVGRPAYPLFTPTLCRTRHPNRYAPLRLYSVSRTAPPPSLAQERGLSLILVSPPFRNSDNHPIRRFNGERVHSPGRGPVLLGNRDRGDCRRSLEPASLKVFESHNSGWRGHTAAGLGIVDAKASSTVG